MDTSVKFEVVGKPLGKQRPRFSRRGNFVRTYTPEETVNYENFIKTEYMRQSGVFFDGEIKIHIDAYFPIPKSTSKKNKAAMIEGDIRPTKKPDYDNIAKVISDALNGVAYADDAQIVYCSVGKWYSEEPRCMIMIMGEVKK